MPLPVIKWKKVGIAMLGFAWHLFRFYFLMSVTCTVTVQLLNAAFFVPSVPKPDAGVGGLLWGFLFFEQFPTVIALQLLLYGSFLFRPEPAFRCVAYLALVLALYFLVLSTTTLMVPKTKYTRALDRIEENHDPIATFKFICSKDARKKEDDCRQYWQNQTMLGKDVCMAIYQVTQNPSPMKYKSVTCCRYANVVKGDIAPMRIISDEIGKSTAYVSPGCKKIIEDISEKNDCVSKWQGFSYTLLHTMVMALCFAIDGYQRKKASDNSVASLAALSARRNRRPIVRTGATTTTTAGANST